MPINITMPALSPTMTEGNLAKWLKKEGDTVKAGDVLAEIETDKATMEVEAVDEGVLGKILVPAGTQKVQVNTIIAVLLEEGETAQNIKPAASQNMPSPVSRDTRDTLSQREREGAQNAVAPAKADGKAEGTKSHRIKASPLARRIAAQKGLDLSTLKGSGPHGRIVKVDIENKAPARPASSPGVSIPSGEGILTNAYGMAYREIPNNNIKRITAKRLLESKNTVPHFYLTIDCMIDELLKARAALNDQAAGAYKLSVNDFVVKAAAMALKSYPQANVSWTDDAVHQYLKSDISVAVATPGGLITPIVRNAEDKGLRAISEEVKALAGRAREGKLKPEEFQGGSFTISNLGMYGIKDFAAIINPPQACILAVGAGIETPVVIAGKIEIRTVMSVTLSTDHRAVDGAAGAEWLQHFKRYIENPVTMLV